MDMYGKTKSGVPLPVRVEETTGILETAGGGKYRTATAAGRVYAAANQAVITTTIGMAATYTGLSVCNPAGSGKNFALLWFGCAAIIAVPTAALTIGLMTGGGVGAATKVIVARNRLSGGPASVMNVDDAVVFTEAPVLEQVFCTYHTGAVTTGLAPGFQIDLDASLIVTPGYHVSVYGSVVNAATMMYSFMWEEYTP
jgi:hypothetical protein